MSAASDSNSGPVTDGSPGDRVSPRPPAEPGSRAALVHREMLQLTILLAVTVLAFFLTRAVAGANRDSAARDAAEWYRRGRADVAAGRLDEAVDAFRRAEARQRGDRTFLLALARALASRGDAPAAEWALTALREAAPEDPEVNLELARLTATRADPAQAFRFYYNALYAPWPAEQADLRRRVRMELIRLLAVHGEQSRALSELLAVSPDVPPDARHQIEIAELFGTAGDHRRALEHYRRAITASPDDVAALTGAGLAAFHLEDYPLTLRYLRRVRVSTGEAEETREIASLVLANDPLAVRLGAAERRRRLLGALDQVRGTLSGCDPAAGDAGGSEIRDLRASIEAFRVRLPSRGALDQDTLENGLEIISRAEAYAAQRCVPLAPLDRALVRIARLRGTGQ